MKGRQAAHLVSGSGPVPGSRRKAANSDLRFSDTALRLQPRMYPTPQPLATAVFTAARERPLAGQQAAWTGCGLQAAPRLQRILHTAPRHTLHCC